MVFEKPSEPGGAWNDLETTDSAGTRSPAPETSYSPVNTSPLGQTPMTQLLAQTLPLILAQFPSILWNVVGPSGCSVLSHGRSPEFESWIVQRVSRQQMTSFFEVAKPLENWFFVAKKAVVLQNDVRTQFRAESPHFVAL